MNINKANPPLPSLPQQPRLPIRDITLPAPPRFAGLATPAAPGFGSDHNGAIGPIASRISQQGLGTAPAAPPALDDAFKTALFGTRTWQPAFQDAIKHTNFGTRPSQLAFQDAIRDAFKHTNDQALHDAFDDAFKDALKHMNDQTPPHDDAAKVASEIVAIENASPEGIELAGAGLGAVGLDGAKVKLPAIESAYF